MLMLIADTSRAKMMARHGIGIKSFFSGVAGCAGCVRTSHDMMVWYGMVWYEAAPLMSLRFEMDRVYDLLILDVASGVEACS